MRRLTRSALIACVLAAGCGEDRIEAPETIRLDQVPAEVMKVARGKLPGVEFETAWKGKSGGRDAYEIRGRNDRGKTREIRVSAQGEVLELE